MGAILHAGLEQGVQHVEAGLVGGKPGTPLLHPTKGAHCNVSVRLAVPRTSPPLQLQQLLRRFLDKGLHRILITEPVAAGNGVVGMLVETVVRLGHAGRAALGRYRVAAHGINLGHHRDAEFGIDLGGGNCGAQSCATASYQKNVVRRSFHDSPRRALRGQSRLPTMAQVRTLSP